MRSYSHKHGSMLSYSTPYNIISRSSYIAYNNPTLMNGQTKRKETNILLDIYSCLKIPNSSEQREQEAFPNKTKANLVFWPILSNSFPCSNAYDHATLNTPLLVRSYIISSKKECFCNIPLEIYVGVYL